MKDPKKLTISEIEKVLKFPVKGWEGNCFAVATQIVEAKLVKGRAVYGHYRGPVSKDGFWGHRIGMAFLRHGWIILPDDTILDPTRWSFEAKTPYLYFHECGNHDVICQDCGLVPEEHGVIADSCPCFRPQRCDYDEGGNDIRRMMMRPPPAYRHIPKGHVHEVNNTRHMNLRVKPATLVFMREVVGGTPKITWEQLHWICNLPLSTLGEHARDIFRATIKADEAAIIPIDNRRAVLGDRE
jgi:hypothetical protein